MCSLHKDVLIYGAGGGTNITIQNKTSKTSGAGYSPMSVSYTCAHDGVLYFTKSFTGDTSAGTFKARLTKVTGESVDFKSGEPVETGDVFKASASYTSDSTKAEGTLTVTTVLIY